MRFTKMQGIGNDYVYVNCFEETVENPAETAVQVSDRHFGVGSDGLILIKPSEKADFMMDMYNADGSQGAMCGNGIRCVAKYVYDKGMTDKTKISIETKSGIKYIKLIVEDGRARLAEVNMGAPILEARKIPIIADSREVIGEPIEIADSREVISEPIEAGEKIYHMTGVSMGNPHAVVYVEDIKAIDIEKTGPLFENHPCFPDRVNTEFVHVIDENTIEMRVWERGSGETLACGTGACASAVASVLNGYTKDEVTVKLLGGDLKIRWDRKENLVYMTGPAEIVFEGEITCLK